MPLKSKVRAIQLEHHLDAALGIVGGDVDDLLLELISYAGRKSPSTHGDAVLVAARVLDRAGRGDGTAMRESRGEASPEGERQEEKQRVQVQREKVSSKSSRAPRARVPSAPASRKVTGGGKNASRLRSKHQRPRPATTSGEKLSEATVNAMLYNPRPTQVRLESERECVCV